MFLEEEIKPDKRPVMAVFAPGREFLLKYFDREFDMRVTTNPAEAEKSSVAVAVLAYDESALPDLEDFIDKCKANGIRIIQLRVPQIIGTGMNGDLMRLARGVARGTMFKIKENEAKWAVIHATDIARAACMVSQNTDSDMEFFLSGVAVPVSELLDALGFRIKNKRVGTLSPRWAKILYGRDLFKLLTTDRLAAKECSVFDEAYPDFHFLNPAEYLTTHVYDNESL